MNKRIKPQKNIDSKKALLSFLTHPCNIYIILDKNGVILYESPSITEFLGYAPEELLGKLFFKFVHPDDEHSVRKKFRSAEGSPEKVHSFQFQFKHKNRSWKVLQCVCKYALRNRAIKGLLLNALDITKLKKLEERLKNSRGALRKLALRLQVLREKERKSIAREIHDELGTALTMAKIDLDGAMRKLDPSQIDLIQKLRSIEKSVDFCIDNLQHILSELRPPLLEDLGLIPAIQRETQEFQKRTGIECQVALDISPEELMNLSQDRRLAFFRIFQEGLINIARHAQATQAEINLAERNRTLVLTIQDNGKGISKEQISAPTSFGLMGMKERVMPWNGKIEIKGIPKKGTRITVRLPMKNP